MTGLFILAAEASAAATVGDSWWKEIGLVLLGGVGLRLIQWIADFFSGSGQTKILSLLTLAQKKANENSVLSQLQIDDALINIVKGAVPEVINTLAENVKRDLKDGKLNKAEYEGLVGRVWDAAKPQVIGGANDYLKQSSWNDGKEVAGLVIKRFFSKKDENKVIVGNTEGG